MGGFGGFYKGEKKKAKKGQSGKNVQSSTPVFTLPEIVGKKKKWE
jgi:hypothetical protein